MNPRDVGEPALFLTRWVTHFCAPVFILLAGISAYLYGARGRTVREISWFLLTRGFWLMLIELTVVRFGWTFDLGSGFFVAQVIWAIGASMVVLAGLVHLPRPLILAVALAMIVGHNAFDGLSAESLGAAGWIWHLLHQPGDARARARRAPVRPLPAHPVGGRDGGRISARPIVQVERTGAHPLALRIGDGGGAGLHSAARHEPLR